MEESNLDVPTREFLAWNRCLVLIGLLLPRHWMDNQHDINGVESLMVLACEKAIESASLLLCGVFGILNGGSVLQLKAHSIRLNAKSTLRMSSQFEL